MKSGSGTLLFVVLAAMPAWAVSEAKVCGPEPTDMAVAYGDVLSGTNCDIAVSDTDLFRFVGTAGDRIRIVAADLGGDYRVGICVELFGPGLPATAPVCGDVSLQIDKSLPGTGMYTLVVSEWGNDAAFPYAFLLERLYPVRPDWPAIDVGIIRGDEVNPVTDQDFFRLPGKAGDVIRINAADLGGDYRVGVCVELLNPDGTPAVPQSCADVSTQINTTLTMNGTHTVIVSEWGNDAGFPYNAGYDCLSGNCAPKLPVCEVAPGMSGTTLNLDLTLRTVTPATWNLFVVVPNFAALIVSSPTGIIDPEKDFLLPVPNFPPIGTIGFLSMLSTSAGIICSDWETVNTGPTSAVIKTPTPEQVRALILQNPVVPKKP
jgi:hypothetical protein